LSGATSSTHLVSATDVGKTLRVTVVATNKNGSATATSKQTAVVALPAAPPPTTTTTTPTPTTTTTATTTTTTTPTTTTTATPAPAPAPTGNRFGFSAGGNLHTFSASDLTRYLDAVAASHAGWVRFDINWNSIQYNGPSSYSWGPFDNVVNAARARGIRVLGILTYTPPWARPAGTTSHMPPTDLNTFATFSRVAAAHFGALGVHHYEIWNEPNISAFWYPGPDPARYTQMLKLSYAAIKAADPSAFVVSGGLAPYGSYGAADAQHMNPINFLQAMYANGARSSMDAVGWHPYAFPYGIAYYNWSAWSQMTATSPSARSVMSANGDSAKQIWATEFGEPTGTNSRAVSETAQAQYVTDSYAALRNWSWAGPAFFYSFHDNGTDKTNIEQNFGVLRYDWSSKPAFGAFQLAAAAG
jgi:hypothetical protein